MEIGLSGELENLVLGMSRKIRDDIASVEAKVESAKADLRSEIHSLRADVVSDFIAVNARIDTVRKETSEQIVGLRRAVLDYLSAVLGHGVLISDLEARVRRMEQHLGPSAVGAS
jgi:outer membrane protein TolC